MNYDGILFDLDGTLWDSCRSVSESWNLTIERLFARPGAFCVEDVRGIMGMTEEQIAGLLFSDYGEAAGTVCHRCLLDEPAYLRKRGGLLYAGIDALLRELAPLAPLFIVSNCQVGYIDSFLDWSGLRRCFTDTRCEGGSGLSKGENIHLLCREYGLSRPVYVGDTVTDERSAAEAGCPFIHVSYGFGAAEAPAAVADSPAALRGLLLEGGTHV